MYVVLTEVTPSLSQVHRRDAGEEDEAQRIERHDTSELVVIVEAEKKHSVEDQGDKARAPDSHRVKRHVFLWHQTHVAQGLGKSCSHSDTD